MQNVQPVTFPGRLYVVSGVRAVIRLEAFRFRFLETGGVLFGYRTDEDDIVVTEATGPGPKARHRRSSFEPDTAYCQARLVSTYERTGGTISYLGEWHTHPYGSTRPSQQDLRSMLILAEDPATRQPEPLLWIYRPTYGLFTWRWKEDYSVSIVDIPTKAWRTTSATWLDAVPEF